MRRLSEVGPGHRVRVSSVHGGQGVRGQLCAMGLMTGMTVEVVSANGGPMILKVMGGRLMLGQGMAKKIMVHEL
ncbi:MAG: ferrous iron transport protein A [Phycisphaerales bacterium]|nr:ferrous iron transport protein A [Phycisphaerales bacterium]